MWIVLSENIHIYYIDNIYNICVYICIYAMYAYICTVSIVPHIPGGMYTRGTFRRHGNGI